MIRLWIIEDNENYVRSLARALRRLPDMGVAGTFNALEPALAAHATPAEAPDVILLDVGLPGMDGLSGLRPLHQQYPEARILILTVFDDDEKIFRAVAAGASGYLLKCSEVSEIASAIRQAHQGGAPMHPRVARRVLDFLSSRQTETAASGNTLSEQERRILELSAEGLSKKEIAYKMSVSVHTVSFHLRHVYEKLHVNTNSGAVAKAIREKLI
jgi:DNA-binding NarL/FixJ family response regulator